MITQQKYQGEADKQRMIDLAVATQAENIHFIDLPYRLSSWALDEAENIGLWVDGRGQLVAWAVMQSPFWTVDCVIRPDSFRSGYKQILEWINKRSASLLNTEYGHPFWFMNVLPQQSERRQALEQGGYICQAYLPKDAWSSVWMELDIAKQIPTGRLPEGFNLRPLAGAEEVEAYVALHQAVFETKNMTVDWRIRTLQQPGYQPELDMVVATEEGRLAAFCIGWLGKDLHGRIIGQIEPLGCHVDYRKFGLGRRVLCETLRRLRQHGAENIYVETDDFRSAAFHLYQGIGFEVVNQVLVYRKDVGEPASGNDVIINNYGGSMSINWDGWSYLLGEWEGGEEGDPGQGHGTFSFSFALDKNILVRRNRTIFPSTAERKGYAHDDLLIIYTEFTGAKRAIYFDNEEHVIHYEVGISPDKNSIVLESDAVPSSPQFRYTYTKTGEDTLEARFEMAPPGKAGEYFTYLQGTAKRIK